MTSEYELLKRIGELERKVEFLLEHLELTYESKPTDWVSQAVIDLIWQGKKIDAIKMLREETNMDLKEAKDAVEELERQYKGR